MKRKALTLAAVMSAALLCSCAQSNNTQQNMQAVMNPTMQAYQQSSMITSANSTAHSIKDQLNTFLTEVDTMACGMKKSNDSKCTVSITVTNGIWTASFSDTSCFNAIGDYYWENDGTGSKASISEDNNLVNQLELDLAYVFPTLLNAYIGAYLQGGRTMFVYFTEDANGPVPELDAVLSSEEARVSFAWTSGTEGISAEGFIVGTAPIL